MIDDNQRLVDLSELEFQSFFAPSTLVAARLPRERIDALDRGRGLLVQGATFLVNHYEVARQPIFDAALLTTGELLADGSARIDLAHPLLRKAPFVGQDEDDSPLYAPDALQLGNELRRRLARAPDVSVDFELVVAPR